jgi:hypothetical protein
MARIVLGIAASHTPLLALSAHHWEQRAAADLANPQLNLSDGRRLTYDQLLAEVGPRYADIVTPEVLAAKAEACQAALDRLAAEFAAAQPDLAIIVGDDQRELYTGANQPSLAVYHGASVAMMDKLRKPDGPAWLQELGHGYLMDDAHVIPGAPDWGLDLISGLLDEDFDVAASDSVPDPHAAGFGHAFGFIVKRLFGGRPVPVLPVLLNTYYPPNVPSARRCLALGQAIRRVVERCPRDARVAVIGSGGLSHFVVDEALDRAVLDAIHRADGDALGAIPRAALQSGSSEILNWIVTAGAMLPTPVAWSDYQPLVRTPAGTGVGAGFVVWKDGR